MKKETKNFKHDLSLAISGKAGQGIRTTERALAKILKSEGYWISTNSEYMSRVRGGSNTTQIRVSSKKTGAFLDRIDILFPLDKESFVRLKKLKRVDKNTIIIGGSEILKGERGIITLPLTKLAQEIGGMIYLNTIIAGVVLGIFGVDERVFGKYLIKTFSVKGRDVVTKNLEAGRTGINLGEELKNKHNIKIEINRDIKRKKYIQLNGSEAAALGAIAGGCNFISSYPMTPSTGVLTNLAKYSKDLDILVEQAEDEISAINMGLGAWYVGARAMVTTSGGGYDLMCEGMSLTGMVESPLVMYIAQRPGPATGLPTRTEQGDLNLALYSGHGEFPRAIFTPGNTKDIFELSKKAFDLADKYQVPVFILSDQFLVDTIDTISATELKVAKPKKYFVKTKKNYKRYKFTANGISPRGIPGWGQGIVRLDSDEHDEGGFITEDFEMRRKMMDKRLGKTKLLRKESVAPELIGSKKYKTLIIGWGSTYKPIKEALEKLGHRPGGTGKKEISFLHFKQVYPLHPSTERFLKKAKNIILVENNATGQFGNLIKLETGIDIKNKILKYNGMPFSVEELTQRLSKTI